MIQYSNVGAYNIVEKAGVLRTTPPTIKLAFHESYAIIKKLEHQGSLGPGACSRILLTYPSFKHLGAGYSQLLTAKSYHLSCNLGIRKLLPGLLVPWSAAPTGTTLWSQTDLGLNTGSRIT